MRKFSRKVLSILLTVMLMTVVFTSTAYAGKPGGGGGGANTAPVISLVGSVPTLTEDPTTPAVVTLSATDKENNRFTWSIVSVSFGTATLSGTISPTGSGTIKVNYTPRTNENGTAVITVQAKDKAGAASTYLVSIVIQPVNDAPVCTTMPSISGTVTVDQTVSANSGQWNDVEKTTLSYAYQWQLADTSGGANATDIAGATASTYTIMSSDAGKFIRAAVTATDGGDNGTAPLSTIAYSPGVLVGQPQPVQEPQYYVALGDSIAAGTNNQNLIGNSYRYTNTFSNSLAAIFSGTGASYGYKNDATPGDTTGDLLSKLQTNSTIRSDVSKATIITISIGGNNVLSTGSQEGYSKINDTAATTGVNDFSNDIEAIVNQINSLHPDGHLPQIYIMDLYNLFHPWERGWVVYSDHTEEGFMNQIIYNNYLSKMQIAINTIVSTNTNVYRVNTYDAFEKYDGRYVITNSSLLKHDVAFISINNPNGSYFYSPYIENAAVYSDSLTRFDIYPFIPILFDYLDQDNYRDPHPEQLGHDILSQVHLERFKIVNGLN